MCVQGPGIRYVEPRNVALGGVNLALYHQMDAELKATGLKNKVTQVNPAVWKLNGS